MEKQTVLSIYDDIAGWFDSVRNKSLFERSWLDFLLSHLPKNASALDLGCGTGEPIAQYLISMGCRITGVDGSSRMISFCRKRFLDHDWIVQDMRQFQSSETFDAIIAWDSFFHLNRDDQREMFTVFTKYCRSQGILLFSSGWENGEAWSPMFGHDTAQMFHASLDTDEYRVLLEKHGFAILKHMQSDPACGGHTYWIAQKA